MIGGSAPAADFDQKRVDNPEARKLESYPLFDWLRFALASIVVIVHEGIVLPGPIDGGLAVGVFLALSGWLIGGILLRSSAADLPRFFFNRATRIWLPYLFTFAAIYGLAAVRDGVDLNWLKYGFYDLTYTHYTWTVFPRASAEMPLGGTGNHFWSISIEEQFYLFAPLLMFALRGGKRLAPWLIVAAVLLAMGSRFAPIALGVIAAVIQCRWGDWQQTKLGRTAAWIATFAFLALMWRWDLPQLRACFAISLVVALAQVGRRRPIGLFLGAISYPVYLNHWMGAFVINALAKHVAMAAPVHNTLTFLAGIVAATFTWAIVDRPVMAYRARWYTPVRGRALAGTAYALLAIGLAGGLAIRVMGG